MRATARHFGGVLLVVAILALPSGTAAHATRSGAILVGSPIPAAVGPYGPLAPILPAPLDRAGPPRPWTYPGFENSAQPGPGVTAGNPSNLTNALLPSTFLNTSFSAHPNGGRGYPTAPAPMGLADLGVGSGGPYAYGTTRFEANITLASFAAYTPGYAPWKDSPAWMTLSLNAVAVGVAINGSQPTPYDGTFWAENAVRFNGHEVQFEDNLWNFSGTGTWLTPGTLENVTSLATASSPLGAVYYEHWGPLYPVSYPLTMVLFDTVGVAGGHPVIYYNYSLSTPLRTVNGTSDQVTFNGGASASDPPHFEVNGTGSNPYGLRDDAELVFGGDGSGANGDIASINGTANLNYWSSGAYVPVRSAYDYGEDSGETSGGLATYYLGSTEFLNAGPSWLYGLWNTSSSLLGPAAPTGWIGIHVALAPEFGILLATNTSAESATAGGNFSFVPTSTGGNATTRLPPPPAGDPYVFRGWADGFDPAQASVTGNSTGNISLGLVSDPSSFDVPLYLDGGGQVAAFGTAGGMGVSYSALGNSLRITRMSVALAVPFRQLNDYLYPTFVLFAADNISGSSVAVDQLVQSATSFTYDWYGVSEQLPGATQGYYFYGGNGSYSVQHVNVTGLVRSMGFGLVESTGPTVEFYGSQGSRASDISSTQTTGVLVVGSTETNLTNLTTQGGIAVEFNRTEGSAASNISLPGARIDLGQAGGVGAMVSESDGIDLRQLAALAEDTAVVADHSRNLTIAHVTVGSNGTGGNRTGGVGISGSHLTNLNLEDWTVSCPFAPSRTGGPPYNDTCASVGWLNGGDHLRIGNLTSVNASGLNANHWTHVAGWNLSARGYTAEAITKLNNCTDGSFRNLSASEGGLTMWYLDSDRNFAFAQLGATSGGIDVAVLTRSVNATFDDINVSGGGAGVEGTMWSSDLRFTNITSATGAEAVGGTALSNVTVSHGAAYSGSLTVILLESENVTIRDLTAVSGSVAVSLSDTNNVSVSNVWVSGNSVALSWWTGTNGLVTNLTASNESIAAQLVGITRANLSGVSEVNNRSGAPYFKNYLLGVIYPDGPVQTYVDQGLAVTNVTAVNCSFGLQDVFSRGLTVSHLRAWGSGTALQFNGTEFSTVVGVFAEGDGHGIVIDGGLNVTVAGSTIEDSTSYGIYVNAGENETFYANNLVANDGASVSGTYYPGRVQAVVYLGQFVNFTWEGLGNFWSDWTGNSPYPIAANVHDTAPAPAFLSRWLEFAGEGLVPGPRWGLTVDDRPYSSTAPLIVVPSWTLREGRLAFSVAPPVGWGATPLGGTVTYLGSNQTVPIRFHLPEYSVHFVESGLPAGTNWTLSFAGAPAWVVTTAGPAELSFTVPNGTYGVSTPAVPGYTETAIEPGSQLTVYGINVTEPVQYSPVVYSVIWEESGLPAGTSWGVTVNGTFYGTNTSLVGWDEPNGTYAYVLSGLPGWHQHSLPYRGTVTVSSRPVLEEIVWFPVRYAVTFAESGIPNGTAWSVVFDGQNVSSTRSTISFELPNGTYTYQDFPTLPTSLRGTPSSGSVTVSGSAGFVNLTFTAPSPSPRSGGFSPAIYAGLGVALAAAIVVGVVAAWEFRRRPPPEEPELSGEDLPLPPPPPKAPPEF